MADSVSKRQSGVELMRIILFFMVVSIHVCGPYFYNHTVVGTVNWQFANFMDGFSRFAVNSFVVTSGYFLLSEDRTSRHVKKLLIAVIPFTLPYIYLVSEDYHTPVRTILYWIDDLLRNNLYFYHMWYIQVMVIIYLIVGPLNKAIRELGQKEHWRLIVCTLAVSSLIPTVCYIIGYDFVNHRQFTSRLGLFTSLYIIGCYIRKYGDGNSSNCGEQTVKSKKIRPSKLVLFLISNLSVVILTAVYNYRTSPLIFFKKLQGQVLEYPFGGFIGAFYDFNNILVVISAALFFMLFINMNFSSGAINFIAKKTFGAYVLHVFWIQLLARSIPALNPFVRYEDPAYPFYALLFIVLVVICSLGSVAVFDFIMLLFRKRFKQFSIF